MDDFIEHELQRYQHRAACAIQPGEQVACAREALLTMLCAQSAALYLYRNGGLMRAHVLEDGGCRLEDSPEDWRCLPEQAQVYPYEEQGTRLRCVCLALGQQWSAPGFWCIRGLAVPLREEVVQGVQQVCRALEQRLREMLPDLRDDRKERKEDLLPRDALSVLAHQLQGHLAGALGGVQVLQHRMTLSPDGAGCGALLTAMEKNLYEMLRLTANVLEAGRLESHPLQEAPSLFSAQECLCSLAGEIGPYAEAAGARLQMRGVHGQDFQMYINRRTLEHILLELIGNALKYTPGPGGCVTVEMRRTGDWARFSVSDNGPGIRPEDRPYLFEKYWRSPELAASRPGTGLGLYIARSLAQGLGGTLQGKNRPQGGAQFVLRLPLCPQPGEEGEAEMMRTPPSGCYDAGERRAMVRREMAQLSEWPGLPGKSD